ncbi:hypothetical protein R6G99_10155, partial [Actinotignum timonense]|nr:hypothetical protein [Actinotignum timonense]
FRLAGFVVLALGILTSAIIGSLVGSADCSACPACSGATFSQLLHRGALWAGPLPAVVAPPPQCFVRTGTR